MKAINLIVRTAGLISTGVLFLMMLLIVADVALRAVLNKPIIGATEIAEQMMVIIVFLGLGWCSLEGRQIRVDIFAALYPAWMQRIIDTIVHCAGLILVAVICWRTYKTTLTIYDMGMTFAFIEVPKYPFFGLATIGWAVFFLSIFIILVKRISRF